MRTNRLFIMIFAIAISILSFWQWENMTDNSNLERKLIGGVIIGLIMLSSCLIFSLIIYPLNLGYRIVPKENRYNSFKKIRMKNALLIAMTLVGVMVIVDMIALVFAT